MLDLKEEIKSLKEEKEDLIKNNENSTLNMMSEYYTESFNLKSLLENI